MKLAPLSLFNASENQVLVDKIGDQRCYRLVDEQGSPHPVLDGVYETMESALGEASRWWRHQLCSNGEQPVQIGVEVSTTMGQWRTLRFARWS